MRDLHSPISIAAILIVTLIVGFVGAAAFAAVPCTQAKAIYGNEIESYTLTFKPAESDAAATSNTFTLTESKSGLTFDGIVIWNQGFSRPNGILMHHCPEGDVTGEELDACTLWQGVMYDLKGGSDADLLPAESDPAASAILLPDIGRALHYSALKQSGKLALAPFDTFQIKGCAP